MSLTQALNTAMAGLQVTQKGLSIVAGNVANVQTPDYVRKTLDQIETANGVSISVRAMAINRQLDQFIQTQVRTETSGGAYADTLSQLFDQLQNIYGAPGSSIGVDALFNNFTTALQGLLATPSSSSAQNNASMRRAFAQQLNAMSSSIQTLRSSAEQGIRPDVDTANSAPEQIARSTASCIDEPGDATGPALMDQRDLYIDQLTKLMSIKVVQAITIKSLFIPAMESARRHAGGKARSTRVEHCRRPPPKFRSDETQCRHNYFDVAGGAGWI
jgi:flagellar hook-associated protein 1 FlgK